MKLQAYMEEVLNNGTLMHIYFKELGVVKYSRDELYGAMDVIGEKNRQSNVRTPDPGAHLELLS